MSREPDGTWTVWDHRTIRPRESWRFLGWVLLGATAAVVLYDVRRWQFVTGPADYLLPIAMAVVGTVLLALSRQTQYLERPLLRIHPPEGPSVVSMDDAGELVEERPGFTVEHYAPGECNEVNVAELTHVVFGLVDYPWPGREGIAIEAFALYLAKEDGTPIPVIDGTEEKLAAYKIGVRLSEVLGLPMIQLGKGA